MIGALSRGRLGLLERAAGRRLLFLATVASSVDSWLALVGLVIDVSDRTGDAEPEAPGPPQPARVAVARD